MHQKRELAEQIVARGDVVVADDVDEDELSLTRQGNLALYSEVRSSSHCT